MRTMLTMLIFVGEGILWVIYVKVKINKRFKHAWWKKTCLNEIVGIRCGYQ